jgi:hypothetical protein
LARRNPGGKKRRTREHVIADLGINHVEKYVLRCGHTVERSVHDYGIDLSLHTYNRNGECENGAIRIQVKATEGLNILADGRTISFAVDMRDVRHWQEEIMPVILVVYDVTEDKAYWLYVQQFFIGQQRMSFDEAQKKVTVPIPMDNVVNEEAVRRFAHFRDNLMNQTRGAITNYD